MLIVSRRARGLRETVSPVAQEARTTRRSTWADTLAMLARSHQARLAAPDPSRPWSSLRPPNPEH